MTDTILQLVESRFVEGVIHHEILRTVGIPESRLAEKIADWEAALPAHIRLAYLPSTGLVKLRLTGVGEKREALKSEMRAFIRKILPVIEKYVFAHRDVSLQEALGLLLVREQQTLAIAESCTGGYLSQLITSIPGSSAYFKGAFVPYSNDIKVGVLGVKKETLETHGAVSEEVVKELAENVRSVFRSAIGISVSGIAGPGGGTPQKPVGTVWVGYSDGKELSAKKFMFTNNRKVNIELTAYAAMNMVRFHLNEKCLID